MQRRDFLAGAAGLVAINPQEFSLNPMVAEKDRYKNADANMSELTARWRKSGLVVVQSAIYDRVRMVEGTKFGCGGMEFFTNVYGKDKSDTNMILSQTLPAPEQFLVLGVNIVSRSSMCDEDHDALERLGSWRLMIGQRRYAGGSLLLSGPQSLMLGGGLLIDIYMQFWLTIAMKEPYTFKGAADILVALPGLHAQGVC
jgi:hypothetical protein